MTGTCNIVGTLDYKINHLSQNGTSQLIKGSSTNAPGDDFKVRISTLTAKLDGFQQVMEGGGFSTVVGCIKFLAGVTVCAKANIPSDAPKFEHLIDLEILLEGI